MLLQKAEEAIKKWEETNLVYTQPAEKKSKYGVHRELNIVNKTVDKSSRSEYISNFQVDLDGNVWGIINKDSLKNMKELFAHLEDEFEVAEIKDPTGERYYGDMCLVQIVEWQPIWDIVSADGKVIDIKIGFDIAQEVAYNLSRSSGEIYTVKSNRKY